MLTLRTAKGLRYPAEPTDAADPDAPPVVRDANLTFLPKQYEFVTATERFVAMVGGVGSGKSRGLMSWVPIEMHRQANSGTLGGIFANTYKQLSQATLPHLWTVLDDLGLEFGEDYVFNEAPPRAWGHWRSHFRKSHEGVLSVRQWGQAVTRSLDNPDNVRGLNLGWATIDEVRDTKRVAFDIVQGRLRCPKATLWPLRMATTPNGFDWIYEELVELPAKKHLTDRRMIVAPTGENTFLPPGFADSLRASYDSAFADQEIEGKFVSLTRGAVYRCFDRSVHLCDQAPVHGWDWAVSFDFNRTPYAVGLFQLDPGSRTVYAVDEIFMDDADTSSVCREIIERRLFGFVGEQARVRVYGDASGRHKDTRNNRNDYDIITDDFTRAYGGQFEACWPRQNPPVMATINAVNAMLRNTFGTVRFYVSRKCVNMIRDFERVTFKPGTREINKEGDKNKRLTHISDGVRYFIGREYPCQTTASVGMVSMP